MQVLALRPTGSTTFCFFQRIDDFLCVQQGPIGGIFQPGAFFSKIVFTGNTRETHFWPNMLAAADWANKHGYNFEVEVTIVAVKTVQIKVALHNLTEDTVRDVLTSQIIHPKTGTRVNVWDQRKEGLLTKKPIFYFYY